MQGMVSLIPVKKLARKNIKKINKWGFSFIGKLSRFKPYFKKEIEEPLWLDGSVMRKLTKNGKIPASLPVRTATSKLLNFYKYKENAKLAVRPYRYS
jgi:hypothetical protein